MHLVCALQSSAPYRVAFNMVFHRVSSRKTFSQQRLRRNGGDLPGSPRACYPLRPGPLLGPFFYLRSKAFLPQPHTIVTRVEYTLVMTSLRMKYVGLMPRMGVDTNVSCLGSSR